MGVDASEITNLVDLLLVEFQVQIAHMELNFGDFISLLKQILTFPEEEYVFSMV